VSKSVCNGHPPGGWDERCTRAGCQPGNLFDDVGIGKVARPAPPLAVIRTTNRLVPEAIGLIEGNPRAAPEVTPRASLLCAEVVAALAFSQRR
jgi:hypothetical protein